MQPRNALGLLLLAAATFACAPSPPAPAPSHGRSTQRDRAGVAPGEDAEDAGHPRATASQASVAATDTGPAWTFEGRVLDLIREQPIADARLTFANAFIEGVGSFATTSDEQGRYSLEVPSLGENGYDVRIEHPDFDSQNTWTTEIFAQSRDERWLLGSGVRFGSPSGAHRGEGGGVTTLDLAVFPHDLTEDERLEQSEAFRKLRGGG